MSDGFASGVGFWIRGWGYNLRHPKLLLLCLVPFFLSLLFIVPLLWILFAELPDWSREMVGLFMGWSSQFWREMVYYPLMLSAGLAIFVGSFFCFYILHSLLAIPFYTVLADRAMASLGKKPRLSASFLRMLGVGLVKTCILVPTGVGLFVCSFLPGLNLLAIAGAMLILAFDVMDYSFESAGFGFRQRVRYLLHHRAQWLGMAAGLALTLPIPALTLLVIPGAVTGGALILKVNHEP